MRNPWALTPEQATARDEAIYQQFLAAKQHAETVYVDERRVARFLEKQFGNVAVRYALLRAINRRMAQR